MKNNRTGKKIIRIISICLFLIFFSAPVLLAKTDTSHTIPSVSLKIPLTQTEKNWLDAHPVIRVAGPKAFPPFHFYETRKQPSGLSVDYLKFIFKALGVDARFEAEQEWTAVMEKAKMRQIDVVACAAKTKDRETFLDFSDSYLSFPFMIVTRKNSPFVGGLNDLNGKKIPVIKEVNTYEWLKEDHIDIIPIFVTSPLEALQAVSMSRADAWVTNLAAAGYLIEKNGLTNLKIAAPTPYGNYDLFFAVRKDWPQFTSILNKALAAMGKDEHSALRNQWLAVRYEYGISKALVYKWVGGVILISILIFIPFMLANRKLKHEIENRKAVEKALFESEEKLRSIIEHSSNLFYSHTRNHELTYLSPQTMDFFDCTPEEAFDKWTDFATDHPMNIKGLALTNKAIETGVAQPPYELELIGVKGRKIFVEAREAPVVENGGTIAIVGALTDITKRKEAENEKQQAQKYAAEQEKTALIGQVAGHIAHDFNNILGAIMGNTELTLLDCEDEKVRNTLCLILDQTRKGKNLTRNLVAFAADQEPKQEFFAIEEKIDLVVNLLKKDLEDIEIIRTFKPGIPKLLADPGMVEHALINMIQNSIHALSKSSHPILKLAAFHDDSMIHIVIEDNGCGIPKEYLDQIFIPSFSLKGKKDSTQSYRSGIKGTGYGMSNVHLYVQKHRGEIDIESEINKGTCLTIKFPVIEKKLTSGDVEEMVLEEIIPGKRILIVEDEPAISDIQYAILTHAPFHHTADIAHNGTMAMDLISRNTYDLISLDYILPGKINGMDIYRFIRESDPDTPILFISGNIEFIESLARLIKKDPYLYHLSKPCMNKEYAKKINSILQTAANTQGLFV